LQLSYYEFQKQQQHLHIQSSDLDDSLGKNHYHPPLQVCKKDFIFLTRFNSKSSIFLTPEEDDLELNRVRKNLFCISEEEDDNGFHLNYYPSQMIGYECVVDTFEISTISKSFNHKIFTSIQSLTIAIVT